MKKIRQLLLIYLCFVGSSTLFAQRLPDGGVHKVHIDQSELTADAEILPLKSPVPDPARWYYWFANGKIRHTQGGFSGHLLHGAYHSFYENDSPLESGNFSAGLKTGLWSSWNTDGILKETVTYRNGLRSGMFVVYDEAGKIRQKGVYRDNLLEGPVKSYGHADSMTLTWYHRGGVVQHQPLFKRLNPFKKHKRDTNAVNP